nr:hypothetical protein [Dictyobacter alpinus]
MIIISILIRIGLQRFLQAAADGGALGPAPEDRVVVPNAEFDQPSGAVRVAASILPGAVDAGLDDAASDCAERIVVVAGGHVAGTVGQAHDGAESIEEIIVDLTRGGALTIEQTTATADVFGGVASNFLATQA